ncbi:MAG: cysteine desulfurase family protein [Enterococcus sp.]
MKEIYLDHAATTPMHQEVIDQMHQVMTSIFGNPSSVHQFGRKAQEHLENARQVIADSLQVSPHEIIFNSGGTESDNTAILGIAKAQESAGKHLITTAIEHPAVLNTMKYLETQGFEITYLPVDQNGQLAVESVQTALRPDTILVSIMTANNETGNLLPIAEIGALLKNHPAYFHTDAVQAYGKISLNPQVLGVDLLSVSAHKINGPKGIGFLYQRDGVKLPVLLHGGEQEEKHRAGTENLSAIVGMAQAIQLLSPAVQQANQVKYQKFATTVLKALDEHQVAYQLNGDLQNKLPHVLNLHIKGLGNDLLLMKLDLQGIAISTGSACTAGNVEPSHVLEAMYGQSDLAVYQSIRISFGLGNTQAEVSEFAVILATTIQQSLQRTRQ